MNSLKISIGKNLLLLALLSTSVANLYTGWFSWKELLAVQFLAGAVYLFLSCYEYLNTAYKASLPVRRFPYFTYGYMMFRVLKTAVFASFALLLLGAEGNIRYLYPVCLFIAVTEGTITVLKYRKDLCFVNIYANYLLIVQGDFKKIFASEVMLVEFRHEILYFVKKNRKTVEIKLMHLKEKEAFLRDIYHWLGRNNVLVTDESKSKIQELLTIL